MKKIGWFWIIILVLVAAYACTLINHVITPLPDWLIRLSGIISIISLPVITYKSVRGYIEHSK